MKKLALAFLSLGLLGTVCFAKQSNDFEMVKAEDTNQVTLNCNDTFTEGYSYSASVYLRTYEELSALSLDVYFDSSILAVTSTYNSISTNIYDSSIHDDHISYSYIFNEVNTDYSVQMFYFYFTVKNPVVVGNYYFDVVIKEAYNNSLENVEVLGCRKNFTVINRSETKSASAYANTSSISTSVNNEFSFYYYMNSHEPLSGSFVIQYDDELFEFVSLNKENYFDNMIFDYNASTIGEIYISFVSLSQSSNSRLFTITLRTKANRTASSKISLLASELYDQDMNLMTFSASQITVNVSYDSSYEINPAIYTSYLLDTVNSRISLNIHLEDDSHLGAGDFVLTFNKDLLDYISYEKHFNPTFFTVNDKESQVEKGQIKFSILSTTDIISEEHLITFVFSYNDSKNNQELSFALTGSGLTDSLTNPISLDISGASLIIEGIDFIIRWSKTYLYMDDPSFDGNGSGLCKSEGYYLTAKTELLKLDDDSINDFASNLDEKYTEELARYLAWASANGDLTPFVEGITYGSNSLTSLQSENGSVMAIVLVLIATSTCLVTLVLIKKRKFSKTNK